MRNAARVGGKGRHKACPYGAVLGNGGDGADGGKGRHKACPYGAVLGIGEGGAGAKCSGKWLVFRGGASSGAKLIAAWQ